MKLPMKRHATLYMLAKFCIYKANQPLRVTRKIFDRSKVLTYLQTFKYQNEVQNEVFLKIPSRTVMNRIPDFQMTISHNIWLSVEGYAVSCFPPPRQVLKQPIIFKR